MHSWRALHSSRLRPSGVVTSAFLDIAKTDLRSSAQFVCDLPYGRNSRSDEPLIVLTEHRGTCSTKHALIRRLAIEQGFNLSLILGLYEMTDRNTPGVGPVLRQYGLTGLIEAHCYLRSAGMRVDITRALAHRRSEPITHFLHEEEIDPSQVGHYKTGIHKKFLEKWVSDSGGLGGLSLADAWKIREECIASLSH